MKKLISLLCVAVMVLGLAACSSKQETTTEATAEASTKAPETIPAASTEGTETEAPATEEPATEAPATEASSAEAPETEVPTSQEAKHCPSKGSTRRTTPGSTVLRRTTRCWHASIVRSAE